MSNRFDSATYLRGLGWNGPGSSLNNSSGGRAKPIVVAQKKTLSGVGRDRDTSFAWWDAIFSSVANKVEQHRTSTGILSHRPPPPKVSAYNSLTDEQKSASASGLNLDAMAAVKLEMARRQLYSGFLRGSVLSSSGDDEEQGAKGKGKEVDEPSKKRKRDEDESKQEKQEKRRCKAEREAEKAAKKAKKEEKAARKAEKRASRGTSREKENERPSTDEVDASVDAESRSAALSGTSTPTQPKEERRAARKLQKSLLALSSPSTSLSPAPSLTTSTLSTSAPTPATPLSRASPALDDDSPKGQAKKAARRAEKEERRLARRAAKKALKELGKSS
ncbi:hypothetical protein Rt10032_c13g5148 [Rhodotorula toruloides]|uniref:G-patch domain-containing protein n=1 Tax=Rhodotorula toruloides TaxID=5286 RepID=A0A511KL94_RHOTO|nr:hypothetical protein Rt10032_c13g5148 [Rhodotorula toruloides]